MPDTIVLTVESYMEEYRKIYCLWDDIPYRVSISDQDAMLDLADRMDNEIQNLSVISENFMSLLMSTSNDPRREGIEIRAKNIKNKILAIERLVYELRLAILNDATI